MVISCKAIYSHKQSEHNNEQQDRSLSDPPGRRIALLHARTIALYTDRWISTVMGIGIPQNIVL